MTHSIQIKTFDDYLRVYAYSLENNDQFWSEVATAQISWRKPWSQVSQCDYRTGKVAWYLGAELNVAENCVDRHIQAGRGNKKALIWVGNEMGEERIYTYQQV